MSQQSYLLAVAIGSPQEFIAAARRTRDLWYGSELLSDLSKAAAYVLAQQGGYSTLIFPSPQALSDLEPGSKLSVSNVVLGIVTTGDPQQVARLVEDGVKQRWHQVAADALDEARGVVRPELWQEQVGDAIEVYAAWVPYTGPDTYQQQRARLMRLLAGRKMLRDFQPAHGHAGVPKSSLDGQRESVLKDPEAEPWSVKYRARFRLSRGEQLDVLGVVKRVGGGRCSYPSVSRVAADPWVRGSLISEKFRPRFHKLVELCRQISSESLNRLDVSKYSQYRDFPFEGSVAYEHRLHELFEENVVTEAEIAGIKDVLEDLPQALPYVAVLMADGDRMGETISRLDHPDKHRKFSQTLSGFADNVRTIVAEHQGVCIYAGGDDVLAFLPVDLCLVCARKLHDTFAAYMASWKQSETPPTLSVGIAIGHFLENMEDLVAYGRQAEQDAKEPDRNGLAVHLYKRSGAPIRVRSRWDEELDRQSPDQRWMRYAQWYIEQALPSKAAYELRRLADVYAGWNCQRTEDVERLQQALLADVLRVLKDKQPRKNAHKLNQIIQHVHEVCGALKAASSQAQERDAQDPRPRVQAQRFVQGYRQLCEELLIARLLADVAEQACNPHFQVPKKN
ncbi:MAG: type III-B CRISPR-associated protein Cas10/Cmr2 [Planctomycetaceae bacterium]|nr:MAG: type III-B CRISPR-associated protein Cas10/Cmr2 [Planctomycetaceae bacterium]